MLKVLLFSTATIGDTSSIPASLLPEGAESGGCRPPVNGLKSALRNVRRSGIPPVLLSVFV